MNKTSIDWPNLTHTWNPVMGCGRIPPCSYCYAKRMNDRFKWILNWNDPQYFPKRLNEPEKVKKPSTVFVGSMSEIHFWEPEWTAAVIDVCRRTPRHTYMFLTKTPEAYYNYDFPENCMLGMTLTCDMEDQTERIWAHRANRKNKLFLSIEPLLGELVFCPDEAELVIVGAMTGVRAVKPKKRWIDSIKWLMPGDKIYWKNNIREYL